MYVCCNLVEPRVVGDVMTPLLGIVQIEGDSGDNVSIRYNKLQYQPLLKNNFSHIHLSLPDDQGEPIISQKGKSIVTLHFQRSKREHIKCTQGRLSHWCCSTPNYLSPKLKKIKNKKNKKIRNVISEIHQI